MKQLRIYNGFGITPTNTHVSAGLDFYVPLIDYTDNDKVNRAFDAFKKSYNINDDDFKQLIDLFYKHLPNVIFERQCVNIIHLYLALYSKRVNISKEIVNQRQIIIFINEYLCFDDNGIPGVKMQLNDTLCINSGIKVALDSGYAGIFFNKSGKGNAGFDVRAQVVDEDYAGYVHLSVAFTKDLTYTSKNVVYCGDKLTQMVVLPVAHVDPFCVDENEYDNIMKNSARGADAFGSSDVKH